MSTEARRNVWWGRIGRVTTGLGVLVLATAAVGAGRPATPDPELPPTTVTVPPSASTLVCPGPVIPPDDSGAGDSAFDPTPVAPVVGAGAVTTAGGSGTTATGTLTLLGADAPAARLEGTDAAATWLAGPAAAVVVRADPTGDEAPNVGAVASSVVTAGDLRGLAAASCQAPGADLWIVGGSTELGSTAKLVLDNAGTTPADVTLAVWGPSGPAALAGGDRYLVAPGGQRVVDLAGVAAEQRRLAVRLTVAGGRVTAHVQDSLLRGFTPAGTDLVVAGAAPSTRQVVAGIPIAASEIDDPDAAVLRLLAPGDKPTTAHVTLLGPDGDVDVPGADDVPLAPGEVIDVPLGGLAAGGYTAVVDADRPVVAAAMVTRPGDPTELDDTPTLERAWVASTPARPGGVVAVPLGTGPVVQLGAVGTGEVAAGGAAATGVVRVVGRDGRVLAEVDVSVPPGQTRVLLPADLGVDAAVIAGIELRTDDARLRWSVPVRITRPDGAFMSVLLPVTRADQDREVEVRVGDRVGLG